MQHLYIKNKTKQNIYFKDADNKTKKLTTEKMMEMNDTFLIFNMLINAVNLRNK
jgi:hypothetical protein